MQQLRGTGLRSSQYQRKEKNEQCVEQAFPPRFDAGCRPTPSSRPPSLTPIAYNPGVGPIHFAVIFLVGDAIGFIAPPYGLNLNVASGMTGIPYFTIVRFVLLYLFALIAARMIIAFWAPISTLLLQSGGTG